MINNIKKRLIWKSKRGLLELDLILSNFIRSEIYYKLSESELYTLNEMLDMNDHDLLYQIQNASNANYKFHKLIEQIRLFIINNV